MQLNAHGKTRLIKKQNRQDVPTPACTMAAAAAGHHFFTISLSHKNIYKNDKTLSKSNKKFV
ncbi:hypothetical protein [Mucilaginibacter conchicola]|uniref:hypothetical protein n=1 Tax=Mucilaginibacter conchicola TaxID=2303333 RepID=UPI001314FBFF|nr:hypothetical protein [Mucilaginibacter conchicola]